MQHVISIAADGTIHAVYSDQLAEAFMGAGLQVTRASQIEFDPMIQEWEVTWSDDPHTVVYRHASRAECVRWEVAELNRRLLEQ